MPYVSENLTALGWGATSVVDPNTEYPDKMREVELQYVGTNMCQQIDSLGDSISEDMLCAGGIGTRDMCSEDSGGPLLEVGDNPSDDLQVGVTSWGLSCGNAEPGIYHRTSASFEWIRSSICKFSMAPPADYLSCNAACSPASPDVKGTLDSSKASEHVSMLAWWCSLALMAILAIVV